MSINTILNALQKVKSSGKGRYVALCPVHGDKKPSLAITETADGTILIHCFSCGANGAEVCSAIGVDMSELFPPRPDNHDYSKVRRSPDLLFSDRQLLECIEFETLIVLAAAHEIAKGNSLNIADASRVDVAYRRITAAVNYQKNRELEWSRRINEYVRRVELVSEFVEFGNVRGIGDTNVH